VTQRALEGPEPEPRPAGALDRVRATLASCLGLGYAPLASGTFGTLGGVGLALLIDRLLVRPHGVHFGLAAGCALAAVVLLGISLGGFAERHWRLKDPGPFVLDEVAGYLVSVLRLKEGAPGVHELLLAFVAFRLFDVMKPWPARGLERLPGGLGIMLDDLVAGLYALALVSVVRDAMGGKWP
jgi:phosphatidylglycerophosphatase A